MAQLSPSLLSIFVYDIMKYEDLFSENINKQKEITALFVELFDIRRKLLNKLGLSCAKLRAQLSLDLR